MRIAVGARSTTVLSLSRNGMRGRVCVDRRGGARLEQDHQDEQRDHQQARPDRREIERAHRCFGDQRIDDEGDAGRNEVAERAAGRERAEHHAVVVARAVEERQRDRAHGGGGGDRRAGDRREHAAGRDVGVQQPAGQPVEPDVERAVQAAPTVRRAAGSRPSAETAAPRPARSSTTASTRSGRGNSRTAGRRTQSRRSARARRAPPRRKCRRRRTGRTARPAAGFPRSARCRAPRR